jgi:hypothetical protein
MTASKPRWPFGYRTLLWVVGSVVVVLVIVAIAFVRNAPR